MKLSIKIEKMKRITLILLSMIVIFSIVSLIKFDTKEPIHIKNGNDDDFNIELSSVKYTNGTIISDGFNDVYWNDQLSSSPLIAIDIYGNLHVVWHDDTDGPWGVDSEIMYAKYSISAGWSNVTVISDLYGWNDGDSVKPSIATDSNGNVHVAWEDDTDGPWGIDSEIMYANYSSSVGWSNPVVISDLYGGVEWNDGNSGNSSIAIDNDGDIYVVWDDNTDTIWGPDSEIMLAKFSPSIGWSNASVISDNFGGQSWNDGWSRDPSIAIDNDKNIHVVWQDDTDHGSWGTDTEIMYRKYVYSWSMWTNDTVISDTWWVQSWNDGYSGNPSIAIGEFGFPHIVWIDDTDGEWGTDIEIMYIAQPYDNATVISDGFESVYWNDDFSGYPSITTDIDGNVHVVWFDNTDGSWGIDSEIMYVKYSSLSGWSNATVISDGFGGIYWNDDNSKNPSIITDQNGNIHVVWEDDTNGKWGMDTEIMYIFTDYPAPVITINNPRSNEIFRSLAPSFNITIKESNLDTFWYTLDGGITNITITEFIGTINQIEWDKIGRSTVELTFYAIDVAGNIGFQSVIIEKAIDYWQVNPIIIDDKGTGDFTWSEVAMQGWCTGSGTSTDPYIIEFLKIDGQNGYNCIEIRHSKVFFVIGKCLLFNSGTGSRFAGFNLFNVSNGILTDNNCSYNNGYGTIIMNCSYITITENEVNNNEIGGIYLESSRFINISNNKDTISYNGLYGIYLIFSNDNTITDNTINYNQNGIYLYRSNDNTIIGNKLIGNKVPITEIECSGNIIKGNSIGIKKFPIEFLIIIGTLIGITIISSAIILLRKKIFKKLFPKKGGIIKEKGKRISVTKIGEKHKLNVFLSYSTIDSGYFQIPKVVQHLEKYPEIDKVSSWEADSKENIVEFMGKTLKDTDVFVLFCSENSVNSESVKGEWQAAYQLNKAGLLKIIPVYEIQEHIPRLLWHILNVKYSKKDFNGFIENLYHEILR